MKQDQSHIFRQQKEIIDVLKKENLRLKQENKSVKNYKELIQKLQQEKMTLTKQIMEMEAESFLDGEEKNKEEEMLFNPRMASRRGTLIGEANLKELNKLISKNNPMLLGINSTSSKAKNNNENSSFSHPDFQKISFSFSFEPKNKPQNSQNLADSQPISQSMAFALKAALKVKAEEIMKLKIELFKKGKAVLVENNKERNICKDSDKKYMKNLNNKINVEKEERRFDDIIKVKGDTFNIISSYPSTISNFPSIIKIPQFPYKKHPSAFLDSHSLNETLKIKRNDLEDLTETFLGNDGSKSILETKINAEVQNILQEKKIFVLKTLTEENFCFDIRSERENVGDGRGSCWSLEGNLWKKGDGNEEEREVNAGKIEGRNAEKRGENYVGKVLDNNEKRIGKIKRGKMKKNLIGEDRNFYDKVKDTRINDGYIRENVDKLLEIVKKRKRKLEKFKKICEEQMMDNKGNYD